MPNKYWFSVIINDHLISAIAVENNFNADCAIPNC